MGFIEKEKRLLLKTRAELLEAIENYQINPLLMLTDEHEHMEIYRG